MAHLGAFSIKNFKINYADFACYWLAGKANIALVSAVYLQSPLWIHHKTNPLPTHIAGFSHC
jgi:hypothetical protein